MINSNKPHFLVKRKVKRCQNRLVRKYNTSPNEYNVIHIIILESPPLSYPSLVSKGIIRDNRGSISNPFHKSPCKHTFSCYLSSCQVFLRVPLLIFALECEQILFARTHLRWNPLEEKRSLWQCGNVFRRESLYGHRIPTLHSTYGHCDKCACAPVQSEVHALKKKHFHSQDFVCVLLP